MNASAEGQVLIVTEPSGPPADAPLRKSPETCGAQGQGLRAGRGDRGQRPARASERASASGLFSVDAVLHHTIDKPGNQAKSFNWKRNHLLFLINGPHPPGSSLRSKMRGRDSCQHGPHELGVCGQPAEAFQGGGMGLRGAAGQQRMALG